MRQFRPVTCSLLAFAVAASACGSDGPAAAGPPTFLVRTPAGIALVQNPGPGEPTVRGAIEVVRVTNLGETPVTSALVKLGDVQIPESSTPGSYDLGAVSLTLAPGDVEHLTASEGQDAASVTFQCPSEVKLDAPIDQATVTVGSSVNMQWTGRVAFNSGSFVASARLRPWNPTTGAFDAAYQSSAANVQLVGNQATATLTIPTDGKTGYAAELVVPGLFADQSSTGGKAICILERRARLKLP